MKFMTLLVYTHGGNEYREERAQSRDALATASIRIALDGAAVSAVRWRDMGPTVRSAGCVLCGQRYSHNFAGAVHRWYRKHDCRGIP